MASSHSLKSSSCAEIFTNGDSCSFKNEEDRLLKDNLVYILMGGMPFIARNLRAIMNQLRVRSLACLDLGSIKGGGTEVISHSTSILKTAMGKRSLIILHGIENMKSQDLERLNYLYRVTDSTYDYSNVIVTLVWNNDTIPINVNNKNNDPSNYWRAVVGDIWSRNGSLVNGPALAGRISRCGMENSNSDYILRSSSGFSNISFQPNIYNDMRQLCDEFIFENGDLQIYVAAVIVFVSLLFTFLYYSWKKTIVVMSNKTISNVPSSSLSDSAHKHNTRSKGKKIDK